MQCICMFSFVYVTQRYHITDSIRKPCHNAYIIFVEKSMASTTYIPVTSGTIVSGGKDSANC